MRILIHYTNSRTNHLSMVLDSEELKGWEKADVEGRLTLIERKIRDMEEDISCLILSITDITTVLS